MTNYKEILRLAALGITKQDIAASCLNTPAGMVRPDRGNGARGTREWCAPKGLCIMDSAS